MPQSPGSFLCPTRPAWAPRNLKAESQSSHTHLLPVAFCCYHQTLFLWNHTCDRRIAKCYQTHKNKQEISYFKWLDSGVGKLVIYLGEIKAHWHCFFAVIKWQKPSNIWKTFVFPPGCWKQLLYFYFDARNLSVCACVHHQQAKAGCEQVRKHPLSLRTISPKNSFSELQHTRHLLTVNQNARDHVLSSMQPYNLYFKTGCRARQPELG